MVQMFEPFFFNLTPRVCHKTDIILFMSSLCFFHETDTRSFHLQRPLLDTPVFLLITTWGHLAYGQHSVTISLSLCSAPALEVKSFVVIYFLDTPVLCGYSSFRHATHAIHVAFSLSFVYFKTQVRPVFKSP